ncbi:HNH endonuclease signature motif containing protein [Pseudonocardia parietis]|uniref:5-methylcytosine-specific restriction protein A n=1 Tax=Pseudonocardia parietis TaxID=570936 RepID=A0ABS4VL55_9PSEU|nr:HNH endonuclease signature motif containing protein [Pseudonocardia parietis]MBP2364657.1 5-methylcytosine-specific restriction protein A [Pseudonocardia parietis]
MSSDRLTAAHRLLTEAVAALDDATGPAAEGDELLSVLTLCEGMTRRLDRITVSTIATLDRRGTFTERGYRNPALALADLLNFDRADARRRTRAAEQVHPRTALDGTPQPAVLPATAERFADGRIGLRHVDVIATVLGSHAARRIDPDRLALAETEIAEHACVYNPGELHTWATRLIEALDEDGPAPDDTPPPQINTLKVVANRNGSGGRIQGRYDDAAQFDAIATAVDALSAPRDNLDERRPEERQAEALSELCAQALDHGDLPETGGRRPVISVLVTLDDLQRRARAAVLDFGGQVTPETLRMLACDAGVVPIVMNGRGQPLDVGRIKRTIPDGLRRAVTARDRGCAHPGCNRPPSWCEVHHIIPWETDGETSLQNCVMLCRVHHRLLHHSAWLVRIRDGLPEFVPPRWIDPMQRPRAQPRLADAA